MPRAIAGQLIHAAWTGKADVVALMASLGFDLHIADDDRMTPLHAAAFHGFADVIRILLEADENPPLDKLNGYGGTPPCDLPLWTAAQLARRRRLSGELEAAGRGRLAGES